MTQSHTEWLSIVETLTFLRQSERILNEEEKDTLVQTLAFNPEAGEIIPGTGGIRKLRLSVKQKGKSGGARVIYYYYNYTMPLFLLDIYAKSEKTNIKSKNLELLRALTTELRNIYGSKP